MIFLLLAILSSSIINWIFNLFKKQEINTPLAITVNYATCSFLGQIFLGKWIFSPSNTASQGFWFTLVLGSFFILIFYAMAKTTHYFGVAANAVSAKMAMVIPSIFFAWYLKESINWQVIVGLILALAAVVLINIKGVSSVTLKSKIAFPIVVFIGSGIIDGCMKWIDIQFLKGTSPLSATTQIFTGAFITGMLWLAFSGINRFQLKDIWAGVLLGIPNFFSILFLLKALQELQFWGTASIFTTINCGIILLSTIGGIVFFKDKLSPLQIVGLGLGVFSIIIIQYAF